MSNKKPYYYYTWKISIGGYGYTPIEAWRDAQEAFNIDEEDLPPEDSSYTREEVCNE